MTQFNKYDLNWQGELGYLGIDKNGKNLSSFLKIYKSIERKNCFVEEKILFFEKWENLSFSVNSKSVLHIWVL